METEMEKIIIMKSDGTITTIMNQEQVEKYLSNIIEKNRVSHLKQTLNDVTGNNEKTTGNYIFKKYPVLHASSGNGQTSVTLFFYKTNEAHVIFAMGRHTEPIKGNTTYEISDYGQEGTDFAKNRKVILK
jgi:hypothetical protein